jgi:DnaJ-class molecular chaperone
MPYCSSCGSHYYEGTLVCSCGKTLVGQGKTTEASKGQSKKERKQERDKICPYCNGKGNVVGPFGGEITITCPVCRGRRYNLIPEDWLKCNECQASGEFTYGSGIASVRKPCPECKGTGWVSE